MNTSQLKRFAQEARKKLITLVGGKLEAVLTQDSGALRAKAEVIKKLTDEINEIGKDALIDKVAYTWFNRLVALRFMDANDYQPLSINILSPAKDTANSSPQILSDIHSGIFPTDLKLEKTYINELLNGKTNSSNPDNDIFREVLITVCNDLHRIFPFLFERIDDYSELLLPDDLTSSFSIIADVVNGMSVEDCAEVEIIGWLYQFYISEKKDEVFASKSKVKKEDIPAATQLFTPRWIVEYMVQNTVGKLWLQNHPQSGIKQFMPYYIESQKVKEDDYLKISSVEEIKLLDQACGSGHILVYGFELLAKIYEEQGYATSEIPAKIIENNLYGLEIDERAAQLAAFAITMKAREFYRRFYRNPIVPHIICYEDIRFDEDEMSEIIDRYNIEEKEAIRYDLKLLEQATNFGSLIQPKTNGYILETINNILEEEGESLDLFWQPTQGKLISAIKQLTALAQKYHCVVDNPPYMGGGNMNSALGDFVKVNYPDSRADLMTCFMEAGWKILHKNGYLGMINLPSWMFLSSFEEFRIMLIKNVQIETFLHLGRGIFGSDFGSVSFTIKNSDSSDNIFGHFRKLYKEHVQVRSVEQIENIFLDNEFGYYNANQKDFLKIPGSSIGYSLSNKLLKCFDLPKSKNFYDIMTGMTTGNNLQHIKLWAEVNLKDSSFGKANKSLYKFHPYQKGGEFRRWFGNNEYVVNWNNKNEFNRAKTTMQQYYFRSGFTWSFITAGKFNARFMTDGCLWDVAGSPGFEIANTSYKIEYILALLNTKLSQIILNTFNSTVNFQAIDIQNIPIKYQNEDDIIELSSRNIEISKQEWNSREISWDFLQNELVSFRGVTLQSAINSYKDYWALQFRKLHQNEEELNRQFIDIYGLQDDLTPNVPLEDITILKEESKIVDGQLVFKEDELIAQLLSYAVGCIFGRYSLDKEGLILANQGETLQDYLHKVSKSQEELTFATDEDNVVPVLDEEWFDDDIFNRIKTFIRTVWGDASYQDNIHYIEAVLGKDLRKYLTKDFYKDHIKRYKKRPIYWMFSSPKGHFNVMIYMHRYMPDTLNFILNSYLRPYMEKVSNDIKRQEDIIITGSAVEQGKARKRQDHLKDILKDCEAYEYDILYPLAGERIAIDLDEGVLVNYNKFGNAIASVAGLNDAKTKKKVREFDWIDNSSIR